MQAVLVFITLSFMLFTYHATMNGSITVPALFHFLNAQEWLNCHLQWHILLQCKSPCISVKLGQVIQLDPDTC